MGFDLHTQNIKSIHIHKDMKKGKKPTTGMQEAIRKNLPVHSGKKEPGPQSKKTFKITQTQLGFLCINLDEINQDIDSKDPLDWFENGFSGCRGGPVFEF